MKTNKFSQMNVNVMALIALVAVITSGCGQSNVEYKKVTNETTVAAPLVVTPEGEVTGGGDDAQRARAASLVQAQQSAIQTCLRLARRNFQTTRYMALAQQANMPGEVAGYIDYTFSGDDSILLATVQYTRPTNFMEYDAAEVFRNHMNSCIARTVAPTVSGNGQNEILEVQAPFIVDLYD